MTARIDALLLLPVLLFIAILMNVTITPSHLAEARDRADLTQKQLAALLDVGHRTLVNWEREGGSGVPRKMEERVRRHIGNFLDEVEAQEQVASDLKKVRVESVESAPLALSRYSDVALLRELLRRAVRRRKSDQDNTDLGGGTNIIDFPPIDVRGLSEDEIARIGEVAEQRKLDTAAGTDDTTPNEDDAPTEEEH